MKRSLICLLAFLLCFCLAAPAAIAEEEEQDDSQTLWDRFGVMAEVTTDENGEPLLVNGYGLKTVRAGFDNRDEAEGSFQYTLDFVDYPFWGDATEYDGNLAVMSLAMALSANRAPGLTGVSGEDFDPALNVEHFLTDAGFTDIRKDDYSKVPTMYTVSTAMGCRRMEHEGEEPFTLIAVGVCGGGYENEWESNMTPGDGPLHEGFTSAARLVVDRLAGYIATRGIEGRIKVWISGYSRAAAVSNVTAGLLVEAGMFPKEDIYAYTFATPAAVVNPPETGFENIFNIIDPMDLIPQVMPADWGYGRYGTDLFLPVEEFSTFLGVSTTSLREETDRDLYGIENNYSPALNLRTRLLFSLLLDLVGDREEYNASLQPAVVGIMENKTVPNTLTTLRSLMGGMNGGAEERENLDKLMDFLFCVLRSGIMREGLAGADKNTGSVLFRLLAEHTENTYISNADTIRSHYYEENTDTYYVMVRGPVTVSVTETLLDFPMVTMTAAGEVIYDEALKNSYLRDTCYIERIGDVTVTAVPKDLPYEVVWTAERAGEVEPLYALCSARASALYPGGAGAPVQAAAGDSGIAFSSSYGENGSVTVDPPEGYTEAVFSASELAEFLGIESLGIGWRAGVTLLCAVAALVVCALLCLLRALFHGRVSLTVCGALCLLGIAALEAEAAFWLFADQPWVRVVWKLLIALCLGALFFLTRPRRRRVLDSTLPVLLLCMTADIVIVVRFLPGALLHLLALIALIVFFLRTAPMSGVRWLQWALAAAASFTVIALFLAPVYGLPGWVSAAFTPLMLLLLVSAGGQPRRLRSGTLLLIAAELMQGLFLTLLNEPIIHAVSTLLLYSALLLLAVGESPRRPDDPAPAGTQPAEPI